LQFCLEFVALRAGRREILPRPGVLDRPVALFNVLVIPFDRFLRYLAGMQVVVVKVGDYVRIQVVLAFPSNHSLAKADMTMRFQIAVATE
jgi:hypothetical protein